MTTQFSRIRIWLIRWIYLLVFGHFAAGILLAWFSNISLLDGYHQSILIQAHDVTHEGRGLHNWWLSLFGATLQNLAWLMALLTYIGDKQRAAYVWAWMILGLLMWAPQDMLISLRIQLWAHVWVDAAVLVLMIPPLSLLCWLDKKSRNPNQHA